MFIVQYTGAFAFIKPWTAVRDSLTFSQQFLTPSILMGIEQKIFPELVGQANYQPKIIRHKLTYTQLARQQEQTQTRGIKIQKNQHIGMRQRAIIERGVLISPTLFLALHTQQDAEIARQQHICLCRNEDLLLPEAEIVEMDDAAFTALEGFELHFEQTSQSFMVGYNRFAQNSPMYGWLDISAHPLQEQTHA